MAHFAGIQIIIGYINVDAYCRAILTKASICLLVKWVDGFALQHIMTPYVRKYGIATFMIIIIIIVSEILWCNYKICKPIITVRILLPLSISLDREICDILNCYHLWCDVSTNRCVTFNCQPNHINYRWLFIDPPPPTCTKKTWRCARIRTTLAQSLVFVCCIFIIYMTHVNRS